MQEIETRVDTSDRLSFTVFVAAALHALVIFGVGFSAFTEPKPAPTIEVTLATHKAARAPEEAEYQAQFNQEASGTVEENKELTTDQPAPFADTRIRDVNPLPETRERETSEAERQVLQTQADSALQIMQHEQPDDQETQQAQQGRERDIPVVSPEIANLRAKLARQRQEYAKRPRIRRLTSVATLRAADAEYLDRWRQKVEAVGNENFPQAALRERIFGQLRLATVVKSDGTIVSVELLQSSGHPILDSAALQIVHLAAPFEPFPPEIAKDTDQLDIIRTWHFEITGLSTTAASRRGNAGAPKN